jgi:putative colanic acid biosynthesis acetyltransferase WcaF
MGEFSAIGDGAEIYNLAPVQIGANSVVSQRCYVCTATHDYTQPDFPIYSLPITLRSSVWIAASVFVAPGVTVGEGAVVGACSVVTKDVPAWTVCAGNPCKIIKRRQLNLSGEDQADVSSSSERLESPRDVLIKPRGAVL